MRKIVNAMMCLLLTISTALSAQIDCKEIDWSFFESTQYSMLYDATDDLYYWMPAFSPEVKALQGEWVCIRGYMTSDGGKSELYITPKKELGNDENWNNRPHNIILLDGLNYTTLPNGMVEVHGRLILNEKDCHIAAIILEGEASKEVVPAWMELMAMPQPNARAIRTAYEDYHKTHPFVKTRYTQAYKRWIALHRDELDANGRVVDIPAAAVAQGERGGGDIWSYAGPVVHYDSDGSMTPGFRHSNVYCHDRSSQNPQVLYCGTESGGAYKTVNGGQQWTHITTNLIIGDVQSIRVNPADDNTVLMSAANDLWRTTDGGETWQVIGQASFVNQNIRASEIAFSPDNPMIIYAATNLGFFRSEDGGDNWTEVLTQECNTLAIKPNDPSVVYTIQRVNNTSSKFFKSLDYGLTWELHDTGWFENGVGVLPEGGRLAVTAADPERIYALLVGYQQDNAEVVTNGWIGTWVSYDAGESWVFPHGLIGTPYTETHPNLMNFQGDDGDYTQINYNTTMIASQLDADKILIGGLNLWKSTDAGATYQGVGGYIGGIDYFHVDQQEYRIYQVDENTEEIWFSNDGGIGHSSDFMESHDNLNRGIQAVNLWGYDQGWNEDMMVGGRYHNGNMGYHELYPAGEFLALGGGENATGYVNYSDENKTFHSDIGGYVLPDNMNEQPVGFTTTIYPNESYWNNSSSRILFDNHHFNTAWLGRDNAIYKSTDGGATFELSHSFSNDSEDRVLWIEQSYSNSDYMYLHFVSGNQSFMYRTTDGGNTWGEMTIPSDLREMVFTVGSDNTDELWIAYYYGTNGQKIYHSADAGQTWDNWTTATLNGEEIWAIAHQYGTNGGVYVAVKHGEVFYRNNGLTDWQLYAEGLPASTEPLRLVPFYKGEKLRLATWNLGVWEAPFYEPSNVVVDFASERGGYQCPGESIHFVNHSVAPGGGTFQWFFPGGTPEQSTEENPTVIYSQDGEYDVTFQITIDGVTYTKIKSNYVGMTDALNEPIFEDFEQGGFGEHWQAHHSTGGNGSWQVSSDASGYGIGTYAMKFDNWYYDAGGNRDEIWLPKWSTGNMANSAITFDVAYARYNATWSDTLAVLVSVDCGSTWQEVYKKGGTDLSTAPDQNSSPFEPNDNQWRYEAISFDPYFDGPAEQVIVAFQNRGYYGQWLYVDNINLNTAMSVNEPNVHSVNMQVFPNPTNTLLHVSLDGPSQEGAIKLYDGQGRLVSSVLVDASHRLVKTFDVNEYAAGIYLVVFETAQGQTVQRVQIK